MPGKRYTARPRQGPQGRALKAWKYIEKKFGEPSEMRYVNDPFRGISKWIYTVDGHEGSIDSNMIPPC